MDVQGEICPYPDVNTRKKLKEMKPAQVLKVIVDYPLSVERIPRNVTAEGHEVLKVEEIGDPVHEIYVQVGEPQKAGND